MIVDAPGASRPSWSFEAHPLVGNQINTIAWGGETPSRIVLPVVPGVKVASGSARVPGTAGAALPAGRDASRTVLPPLR